jgi:Zn-dependent metalloprotease
MEDPRMTRMSRSALWSVLLGAAMVTPGCAAPSEHVALTALGTLDDHQLAQRLGLGADGGLVAQSAPLASAQGTTMQRMQQTYHGIPVRDRGVVVERDAEGRIVSVRGDLERHLSERLAHPEAKITPQQAIESLRRHQDLDAGAELQNVRQQLIIDPRGETPRLVYEVSFFVTTDDHPQRPTGTVDASNGEVLQAWDGLTTGDSAEGSRRSGGFVGPRPSSSDGVN